MGKERYNLGVAYEKAAEKLREFWEKPGNFRRICKETGCRVTENGAVIPYFGRDYLLRMPEGDFSPDTLPMNEKILLLHYLLGPEENRADPSRPAAAGQDTLRPSSETSGPGTDWISFNQLPGAAFYGPTYKKRGPDLVVKFFHTAPEQLVRAGTALGGEKGTYGDYSVILHPFPNIDVMLILYAGDDEFPSEGQVLFSGDIGAYLSLEDTAVLAGVCAVACMKVPQ